MADNYEEWMKQNNVLCREPDGCDFCHGAKGGVPGNEQVVGGYTMCDYCYIIFLTARQNIKTEEATAHL